MIGDFVVEAVCTSVQDCIDAERAGANRLELVSAIELGGLTPSLGLVEECVRSVAIPIMVMIRPRSGGFVYAKTEIEVMKRDISLIREAKTHGVVFGALTGNGEIDYAAMSTLMSECGDMEVAFHRAFDSVLDQRAGLEALIELGFDRVMTSGGHATGLEGAQTLRTLFEQATGRIDVMAAGGVRPDNAAEILRASGCRSIHLGPFLDVRDDTPITSGKDYGTFKRTDVGTIKQTVDSIQAELNRI